MRKRKDNFLGPQEPNNNANPVNQPRQGAGGSGRIQRRPASMPPVRDPRPITNDPNRPASKGVPAARVVPERARGTKYDGGNGGFTNAARSGVAGAVKAGGGGGGGRNGGRRRAQSQMKSHTDLVPALDSMPVNKSVYNGSNGIQQSKKSPGRGPANQVTRVNKLRVIPLGGLGEVGKNMMAIEYENDIVIIDMGFGFPTADQPGVDYILPDVTYLERNRHKVKGIVITHGHMDHVGASGYMIPKFPVPVYGSRLSLAFVEKQISEFKIQKPRFVVMDPDKHEKVQIGVFQMELVRVTHTIADSTGVILKTPVGTVVNTGDWRPDPNPLDHKPMDFERFRQLGEEGVLLLMSDSTSCDRAGHTTSEEVVVPTIDNLFHRAENRILVTCFSSSITRVQVIIDAAAKAGRKLALVGRSTLTNVEVCVKLGYIKIPAGLLMRVQDIINLPDDKIVILTTGSQGEDNSALVRMSTGDHQNVKIKPGDTIIFSNSVIPGNEKSVVNLQDNLMREGAILYSRATENLKGHGPVHVGGHGFKDDVGDLITMVKPKFVMPIHGEFHHLVYGAEAAVESGVPRDNCFVMDNGDVLELTADKAEKGQRVPAGIVMVDGAGVGDVEGVVLRDRLALGGDGVFMIVATVSRKTGRLVSSPDIISRGFIYMKENEDLVNRVRAEVRKEFEKRNTKEPTDWAKFKLRLRDDIGDLLYSKTKRNPMILPVVNEV
jgi:ribonuclease J